MNGITSMQRSSTSYADYGKFANGKKVNRAADGAAELAIIQKQETQTRSYKVGGEQHWRGKRYAECGGWRNERDYGLSSEDP